MINPTMGTKKKKEPIVWTEERMQERLHNFRSNPRYLLKNLYVFGWESDLLFLSTSGIWTEIEIKVSRSDFLADLRNKTEKHAALKDIQNRMKPNRFFYAVPEGLVQPEEVPEYAGLIWVSECWFSVQTVKKPAPPLHRHKVTPEDLKLADKFYNNMVKAKMEAIEAKRKTNGMLEPYKEGFSAGIKVAVQATLKLMMQNCPHRSITDEGRIHCSLSGVTQYNLCIRCDCNYLADKEEYILKYINSQ